MVGFGIPIIGDIFGSIFGVFSDVAGWAVDAVISAITSWIVAGVMALIEAIWGVIDESTSPMVDADWFSGDSSSPLMLAVGIGTTMMTLTLVAAVVRSIIAGSPGGIAKAVGRDVPTAVFTMICTIAFTKAGLDLMNAISDWVWAGTRDDALIALDNLSLLLSLKMPGTHFVGVAIAVVMLLAMLFLWVVLFVREALIYLVIVFAAAFAWPMTVFPPLRDTGKKSLELLVALILCKPVITLALSVGVSALASLGRSDVEPGVVEVLGTLVVGAITFGLAAFMPFLVWKLMPLVVAAVVAQGVASGPMRAAQQGMQLQYYGRSALQRLGSGGHVHGAARPATSMPSATLASSAARPPAVGAAGAADAVAGPAAVAVVAAKTAGAPVKRTVTSATSTSASASAKERS